MSWILEGLSVGSTRELGPMRKLPPFFSCSEPIQNFTQALPDSLTLRRVGSLENDDHIHSCSQKRACKNSIIRRLSCVSRLISA